MVERQPNRPPIPEPQHTPHEGGNGALGLPRTVHESAKPPPEAVVNKPRLTPEERREKKRKYVSDYKKRNRDKVNEYQRRTYRYGTTHPNEKLREYQYQRALERWAKQQEQETNEPSADLELRDQQQSEAMQIFPSPPEK
jgi:hypothetical protein